MKITEIRERKASKVAEMRSILTAVEAAGRQLTADEAAKFDGLKIEIEALEQQEARATFLDEQDRRSVARPADGGRDSFADLESRVSLLAVVSAQTAGRALTGAEAEYAAEAERRSGRKAQGVFVPLSALEKRAPGDSANSTTTADKIIPTIHRGDQYIGPLRDSVIVRSLGVRVLSDLTGNIEIPRYGSGLSAAWVNENEAIAESGMTFDSVQLKPRHVGAISSWSRQLAQQSNPGIESLLRDDLAHVIGAAVDRAIISGNGVKEPLGIVNTVGIQPGFVPLDWDGVLTAEGLLEDENVNGPLAWYTSPTILRALRGTLKSASAGADYIATKRSIGELPAYTSNAAPAGTAILGDFSQVILGTCSTLDVLVNPYEAAAYARGNVLIRAMMTCDTVVRHPKAFVVCEAGGS